MQKTVYLFIFTAAICFFPLNCSLAGPKPLRINHASSRRSGARPYKSLLKDFNATRDHLSVHHGTTFAFAFSYIQQMLLHSQRHEYKSRGVWYGNLALEQRLWPQATLTVEGEVDKNKGIDKFLPTYSIFNSNTGENASFYIPELFLKQDFLQEKAFILAGKLDLADWFDDNTVSGSADTQFFSSVLVNNPVIPFPGHGFGVVVNVTPAKWVSLALGSGSTEAFATKVGLNNAFSRELFISEFGLHPELGLLKGNYRFICYLLRQKIERIDNQETQDGDHGFSLSFDQELSQKASVFLRFGFADKRVRDVDRFCSYGMQIVAPFSGRDQDCFGLAVAHSFTGKPYRQLNDNCIANSEIMYEAYYNYSLNQYSGITADLQVVLNPGFDQSSDTAVTCGLRFFLSL